MGKPSRERSLAKNEAMAVARNLRVSPQKLNLVAGLIRGRKVEEAVSDLEFSRKRIAKDVLKCVKSAVANAENNHGLDIDSLIVAQAWVGKNLVMKRFAARGRGRSAGILKPFSEITVVVREQEEQEKKSKSKSRGKGAKSAGGGKAATSAKETA
jgi:large subunit ribosomal protein L22